MNKLTKIITITLAAISVSALSPIGANAEWRQDSNGWWYTEGSSWATGERVIDGQKYYFGKDGYMSIGWKNKGKDWFYYDDHGYSKEGWLEYEGKRYYLSPLAKYMVRNRVVDGWYLDSDGIGRKCEAIGDYEIDKVTGTITKYNGKDTEVVIPSKIGGIEVNKILGNVFEKSPGLTSVTIPASVNSIDGVFYNCNNLKSIIVDDNNKNYSDIDGVLFNKSGSKLIIYPKKKENEEYIIPGNVDLIESGAFMNCANLKSIKIPTGILNMGKDTFRDCSASTFYVGDEETKKSLTGRGIPVSKIILDPKIAEMTPANKKDPTVKFSNVSISKDSEWIKSKNTNITGNKFVGFSNVYLKDVFPTTLYAVTDSTKSKFEFLEKEELDKRHDKADAYQIFVGTDNFMNVAFIDKNFSMSQLDKNNGITIKGYLREFTKGVNRDIHINVGGHIYYIEAESYFYCNIE